MSENRRRILVCVWFAIVAWIAPLVHAQTFDQVPYYTCQNRSTWAAFIAAAETALVRVAQFGDSQETSPGGQGTVFLARGNWEPSRTFGHIGETPIAPIWSYGEPAHWLVRGGAAGGADATSAVAANKWLPSIPPDLTRFDSADAGALVMLQSRAASIDAGAELADTADFWNKAVNTVCDIFCYTLSGGNSGLAVDVIPVNSASGNYFATPTATISTGDIGLNAASGTPIKYTTPVLGWNGLTNMQVIARSGGAGDVIIAAMRYRSATTKGVTFSSFSAGGYDVTHVLANHANAGPMLNLMGPWDAIWLSFGANDAAHGVSAANFKTNVETLISTMRGASWLNNPNQKFIITTDAYNANMTSGQRTEAELMPAAAAEIAAADANVLAINEYRIMYDAGQNPSGYEAFLADGVHHTALGARVRAALLWNVLKRLTVHNEGAFR